MSPEAVYVRSVLDSVFLSLNYIFVVTIVFAFRVWALWPQIFHLQLGKNPILRAHLRSCQILLKFLQFVFFHLFVHSTLFPAVICHLPLCRLELSLQLLLQVLHPVCHVRNLMLWTAVYLPSSSPTTPSDESCAPYPVPGDNPEDTPLAR